VTAPAADLEHLDVLVVGAGLSGIGAAHYLRTQCPWARFAIVEARHDLGGTWDLFRYPGIRSDSDMFTLGYSFRPWDGERAVATGDSILEYLRATAAQDGTDALIRYGQRVVRAEWSTADARWTVTLQPVDRDGAPAGDPTQLTCGFLFCCTGYYRYDHGYLPDFEGLDDFRGTLVHPQQWPEDLDVEGRRVVVIGSGATAITLVPALADRGAQVTMLQRSPTYLVSLPAVDPVANALRRALPARLSGPLVRRLKAGTTQASYRLSRRHPRLMRRLLVAGVARQLPAGFDVETHFQPHYDPWDQRLCLVTDGDLFRGIREGRIEVVTDHVERFVADGVRLRSGRTLAADVVVTATGLELLFLGGMDLAVDGTTIQPAGRLTYRGMMLDGVPNLAFAIGYTNASWTLRAELTFQYVARLLNHLHRHGLRQATPHADAAAVSDEPLLGLTSGYVQRARDRFPAQGRRDPWRVHQSWAFDRRALRRSAVADEDLVLSNPAAPADGGRVAVVTGAGSGIGRALAVELCRRGYHVALCDIDDAALADTVAACEGFGTKVAASVVDVADRAAVDDWAGRVGAEFGAVHLAVNNAGVALAATASGMSPEDLDWILGVNFRGVVHGTQAFLPLLEASGDGHLVNVSSVFGLVPIPTQSAYNATKFAVRAYSDALRMELELAGSPVTVTTVHPGGIRTNIARNARISSEVAELAGGEADRAHELFDRVALTTPERAARQILAAVDRRRRRALIGPDARVFALLSRLPVGWQERLIVAVARRRR
jgi:cation diffusion facilitator CzcD-associated flavoprotein CzcO/NADP-dependent 3-hydroxy acid dehydrogenase YdfG